MPEVDPTHLNLDRMSSSGVTFASKLIGYDFGGMSYNVRSLGAKGDGVTDDSAFIGSSLPTNPGSTSGLWTWPAGNYNVSSALTISASNVRWRGANWSVGTTPYPLSRISSQASGLTALVKTSGSLNGTSLWDLALTSNTTNSPNCIGFDGASGGTLFDVDLTRLMFDQFGSSAIQLLVSVGAHLDHLFAQNCLKGVPTSDTGVFDLNATDVFASHCFATIGASGAGNIGNGHSYAWVLRGSSSNGNYFSCYGDQSQHGWLIVNGCQNNGFFGCRAFQNQGNGFNVAGGKGNKFIGCLALSNSQTADNTYAGFIVTGGGNTFIGNVIDGTSGDARQQSNGFDEQNSSGVLETDANHYTGNYLGPVTKGVLYNCSGGGSIRVMHPHGVSADRGDNSVTVTAFVDAETQQFASALTANRTITFANNGGNLVKGARFRVVRRASATGAFTLTAVGTESKALSAGQWVDYEVLDDRQWHEVAFGSL